MEPSGKAAIFTACEGGDKNLLGAAKAVRRQFPQKGGATVRAPFLPARLRYALRGSDQARFILGELGEPIFLAIMGENPVTLEPAQERRNRAPIQGHSTACCNLHCEYSVQAGGPHFLQKVEDRPLSGSPAAAVA